MAIKDKEYLFAINDFKKPAEVTGNTAVGVRLMELMLMHPGSDPLHPDMGVGLRNYRYSIDSLNTLGDRIEDQIKTYLPMYNVAKVDLIRTPQKTCNIIITIDDVEYIYDSSTAPIPIMLEDIEGG